MLTSYWYRTGSGRLHLADLPAFHAAFGQTRFATGESSRGTLSHAQLCHGAQRLLGDWFAGAYADDARRAWGIAFETVEDRAAYDPRRRLRLARLGGLTPECAPPEQQTWHTYPAKMPSVEAVVAALTAPETWPDLTTRLRSGASLRCARVAWTARRLRSRLPRAPRRVGQCSLAGMSRSPGWSALMFPKRSLPGSPSSKTGWRATVMTSPARCPAVDSRWLGLI